MEACPANCYTFCVQPYPCPVCQSQLNADWYFCPNCGKILKDKVPVITVSKQILIYLVSFFFAPLGLGWGFKYARSSDTKVRIIGIVSILLTVASLIGMALLFKSFAEQYSRMLNEVGAGLY